VYICHPRQTCAADKGRLLMIRRWLLMGIGIAIVGSPVTAIVVAQSPDTFREAPPPPSTPRPHPLPQREPVVTAPAEPAPIPFPYDGLWVGMHRCPEFNNRQAFEHPLSMQIRSGRASAVTSVAAGAPGYITFDGATEPNGKLALHGYAISRGQPGASPAGTQFPFDYDGAITGDTYTAHALGSRPCTIELSRRR
jgi:hypothetical protein